MKRRSATRAAAPPELIYFTDRDLGQIVPRILREAGLRVETYAEHFVSQVVPDDEWLQYVGKHGWVGLSHDLNIRYDMRATEVIMRSRVKLFILRGKLAHPKMAERFLTVEAQARRLTRKLDHGFIAKVYVGRDKPDIEVWLDATEWEDRPPSGRDFPGRRPADR